MTQDDEISASLLGAGIGTRYHKRSLAEFGAPGEMLRAWISQGHHVTEIHQGIGYTIVGGIEAHDLLVSLARGCHLSRVGVRVTTLSRLLEAIQEGTIDDLDAPAALFISAFFVRDYPVCPLTPNQRMKVEDFLMRRMDDQRAIFLQTSDEIANTLPWWSGFLVQRVAQVNREIRA